MYSAKLTYKRLASIVHATQISLTLDMRAISKHATRKRSRPVFDQVGSFEGLLAKD